MMNIKNKIGMSVVLLAMMIVPAFVMLAPVDASAQFSVTNVNPDTLPDKLNLDKTDGVLMKIINIFLSVVAGIAILVIIISGILYMTSGGDETRIETAKKWLIYAIVGLAVAILSYAIVNLVFTQLSK